MIDLPSPQKKMFNLSLLYQATVTPAITIIQYLLLYIKAFIYIQPLLSSLTFHVFYSFCIIIFYFIIGILQVVSQLLVGSVYIYISPPVVKQFVISRIEPVLKNYYNPWHIPIILITMFVIYIYIYYPQDKCGYASRCSSIYTPNTGSKWIKGYATGFFPSQASNANFISCTSMLILYVCQSYYLFAPVKSIYIC